MNHTRDKQGQRELFSDFLQRLAKAVQIGVTNPDARGVLIESLTFEKAMQNRYLGLLMLDEY